VNNKNNIRIDGQSLCQLAPHLVKTISSRAKKRSVHNALTTRGWVQDIRGAITLSVLSEFFNVWDLTVHWDLHQDHEDKHIWLLSSSGLHSTNSAYAGFFFGSTTFKPWERIWKACAPGKCKFFMWLVAHGRCWTADRLARKGLPHPHLCPLCDQEEETLNHLLISCVFPRDVWFQILKIVRLQHLAPNLATSSFEVWWEGVVAVPGGPTYKGLSKGLNSLIIIGAWAIWNHRNRCVFNGEQPCSSMVIKWVKEESHYWCRAGASGLDSILSAPAH
jgi:hypothetical protein